MNKDFKVFDVVSRVKDPKECRVILSIDSHGYFYIDYDSGDKHFMYAPTHAYVGKVSMNAWFKKIGTMKNGDMFLSDVCKVMEKHNEAFKLSDELLSGYEIIKE